MRVLSAIRREDTRTATLVDSPVGRGFVQSRYRLRKPYLIERSAQRAITLAISQPKAPA